MSPKNRMKNIRSNKKLLGKIKYTMSSEEQRGLLKKLLKLRYNPVLNFSLLILLSIGVGLVSLLLGASTFGLSLFWEYFSSPMVVLLNLAPPILLILLVYFISGRAWIAFTFPSLLIIFLSLIQFYKVQIHGDSFIFYDIRVAREVAAVLTDVILIMNWKIYFAIIAYTFGILFSIFFLKYKLCKIPVRAVSAVVAAVVSAGLYLMVYTDTDLYAKTSVKIAGASYSATRRHISKGFMYAFIHSVYQNLSAKPGIPDWYDPREARELGLAYPAADIPADKKVNIIVLMLESYADLSRFDLLDFEVDIYVPLRRLQEESISGTLVTNVFAGWTIDTERLFLTGNTQFISYTKPTNSYIHYLNSQGYSTEGLHTGEEGWFYDRRAINSYMGFSRYLYRDDFEGCSDEYQRVWSGGGEPFSRDDSYFFPAVLDLYEARDRSKPYFSYSLSYQNHVGYKSDWMLEQNAISQGGITDESFKILTNYLAGIYDTTWRLERFIDSLRADPEPVVVLVFGDHMPWLGSGGSVYAELGINIDQSTEDGFYTRFSTPYFIWANSGAKMVLGRDFTGDGGSFSPCFLMGELFRLCSWEGDGQMRALREFMAGVDIINAPYGMPFRMFRENGALTEDLSPAAAEAYRRLLQMEVYRRENFLY